MFNCDICKKSFGQKHQLERHLESHSKQWQCSKCDWSFPNKYKLESHVKEVHEKIKYFPCQKCDKYYTRTNDLQAHINVFHNGINFVCDKCSNVYKSKIALSQHKSKIHLTYQAAKDFYSDHSLTIVTLNIHTLTSERKMNLFKHFIVDIGCP
jgi:hypothetical protein